MEKAKLVLPIAILATLVTLTLVSAAITLDSPVVGGNFSGTMAINCTKISLGGSDPNVLNVTIMYNASGGSSNWNASDTSLLLITAENTSDDEYYNSAVDISSLSDGIGYNVSCWAFNGTDPAGVTDDMELVAANITIDNTAPTSSVSVTESTISYGSTFTYNTTLVDATSGVETSSCQLLNPLSAYVAITLPSDSSIYTDPTRNAGTWNLSCNGTDYAGNTISASDTFTVNALGASASTGGASSSAGIFAAGETLANLREKLQAMDRQTLLIIGGLIVVIYLATKKK